MAIDNSVIKIPSLVTVSVTDKINVQGVGEQVYLNNGVYVLNSSLNKTLPKSVYKVWSKNNKVYLIERQNTRIEQVIDTISSKVDRAYKIGGSDNSFAFVDRDNNQLAEKAFDYLLLTDVYGSFNNSSDNIKHSLSTITPYTSESTLVNHTLYKDKVLNLYKLKPEINTNYLQFIKPQEGLTEIVNSNLFLRIKSLFSTKEIRKNYYNYFTYLFAHWTLFGVDETNFDQFDPSGRNTSVKQKLIAPLKEQDLNLFANFNIINSKKLSYSFDNVRKFDNVLLFDTSDVLSNRTLFIADTEARPIFDENNYTNYINKVFVLEELETGRISALSPTQFYDVGELTDGIKATFSYTAESVYNSLGGAEIKTSQWTKFRSGRLENKKSNYRLLVYERDSYVNVPVEFGNSILELELDSELRTNSEGDFYVLEIL